MSPIRLVWTTKTDLSVNAVVTPQLQVKTDKKNYALLNAVMDGKLEMRFRRENAVFK